MAQVDEVLSYLFKMKVEKGPVLADFKEIKAGFVDLAATANKGSDAASTLTKKLGDLNRAAQVDKLGKDFGTMATKIGDADNAAKLLAGRLADIGASKGEIEAAGAAFAQAQQAQSGGAGLGVEGLRRTGGALTQLGLGAVGAPVQRLGDIGQVVKEFQQLSQVIPGVTTVTAALTPALGATAAGFAAVLAPIASIAVALAPLIIALKMFSDQAEKTQKAYQDEIDAQVEAERLKESNIEKARTLTNQANIQESNDNQQRFKDKQDFLAKLRSEQAAIDAEYANSSDPFKRNELAGKGEKKAKEIEDAQKDLIDLGNTITNAVTTLGPEIDSREKEAAAIKSTEDALKAQQKVIADNGKVELEARTLAKTATQEQVRTLLDSIATQRAVLAEQAKQTEALGLSSKEYTDQIVILDARTKALTDTTLAAAIANDKAKDSAKSAEDAGKAAKKYQDDIASVNEKYYQDQIDAAQKLADKETEIQDQAVQAAEQLLQGLQQKFSDLSKNLGRSLSDQETKAAQDALQKQIDFQRQEVAAEKKYQADIARIRQQAQEAEFEQGLDRDFAGLARTKRQTAQQISAVTQQANEDRAARLQAFRDQQDDAQRAFANERALKILQYQRQVEDAQEAFARDQKQLLINRNRALVAAQQAEQKELAVLQDKHTKELNAKYAAAKVEINLAMQTSAVRKQILDAELAHALAIFNQVNFSNPNTGGTYTPTQFAFGGSLGAGRFGMVNEPGSSGRESFTSGGRSAKFPSGKAGYFMPFTSGNINSNRGGDSRNVSVSNTFNISGSNPQDVMKVIDTKLEQSIRRIFQVKAN